MTAVGHTVLKPIPEKQSAVHVIGTDIDGKLGSLNTVLGQCDVMAVAR